MRKGQAKIVNNAKKKKLPKEYISYLEHSELSLNILTVIFHYMIHQQSQKETLIKEIVRCLDLPYRNLTQKQYCRILGDFILPNCSDPLFESDLKSVFLRNDLSFSQKRTFKNLAIAYCNTNFLIKFIHICEYESKYDKKPSLCSALSDCYIPNIIDELRINKENSMLYYIIHNYTHINDNKMDNQQWNEFLKKADSTLKKNHYLIKNKDINWADFFIKNRKLDLQEYIESEFLQRSIVIDFMRYFDLTKDTLGNYCEYYIPNKNELNMYIAASMDSSIPCYIYKGIYQIIIDISYPYIIIKVTNNNKVMIKNGEIHPSGITRELIAFSITNDNAFIELHVKGKSYPLTLKRMLSGFQNIEKSKVKDFLFGCLQKLNPIFKDIFKDNSKSTCLLPIPIHIINQYYNKKHLMNGYYKRAKNIQIPWTKININVSYMIMKAFPSVKPGTSQNILLQIRDERYVEGITNGSSGNIKRFLANIIYDRIISREKKKISTTMVKTGLLDEENDKIETFKDECDNLYQIAKDYVSICKQLKEKVFLSIKSSQELVNKHNKLSRQGFQSTTSTDLSLVHVPQNTIFQKLRAILPKEFEWIKNTKRLRLESAIQGHCVWSYGKKISEDKCAIYSFVDYNGKYSKDGSAKRYTIEFAYNAESKKYYVVQTQGKYDQVNASGMNQYIQKILDTSISQD